MFQIILLVLADAAIKSVLLLGAAGVVAGLLRRASAATRHLVWLVALIGMLALPLLAISLPAVRLLPVMAESRAVSIAADAPRDAGSAASTLHAAITPAPVTTAPERPAPQQTTAPTSPAVVPIDAGPEPEPQRGRRAGLPDALPFVTSTAADAPVTALPWRPFLLLAYALGVLGTLSPLLLGLASLRRLTRRATPVTDPAWLDLLDRGRAELRLRRPVVLLQAADRSMPMTWGGPPFGRAKLLLPAGADDWSADRRRAVLLHELAHVKRFDAQTHTLAQFARALYWFNPLAWVAVRRLAVERERACDDAVLAAGGRACDYAEHLLAVATGSHSGTTTRAAATSVAIAMARPSTLEGRLLAILDPRRNRRGVTAARFTTIVLLAAAVLVPVAMLRATDDPVAAPAPDSRSEPAPADDGDDAASGAESLLIVDAESDPRDARTRQALQEMIPVNFDENRLADVLDYLRNVTGVNLYVNWPVLEAGGIEPDDTVTLRLHQVPAEQVLQIVLQQVGRDVRGLDRPTYTISEGIVTVSSLRDLHHRTMEVRAYDIRDLTVVVPGVGERDARGMPEEKQHSQIVRLIADTIGEPQAWDPDDGHSNVRPMDGQLIIKAPAAYHREITALLGQLRESRALTISTEARFIFIDERELEGLIAETGLNLGADPDVKVDVKEVEGGDPPTFHLIDDAELDLIIRTLQRSESAQSVAAPRLTAFNHQWAEVQLTEPLPHVGGFKPPADREDESGGADWEPVTSTVQVGLKQSVRGTLTTERHAVALVWQPRVTTLTGPTRRVPWPDAPEGSNLTIEEPQLHTYTFTATLVVPDRGTVLAVGPVLPGKLLPSDGGEFWQLKRRVLMILRPTIVVQPQTQETPPPALIGERTPLPGRSRNAAAPAMHELVDAARRFVSHLAAGQFDEATEFMDDGMKAALPADGLREMWTMLVETVGAFAGVEGSIRVGVEDGFRVVYLPARWERNRLGFKVVFDDAGRITGFWTAPPTGAGTSPHAREAQDDIARIQRAARDAWGVVTAEDGAVVLKGERATLRVSRDGMTLRRGDDAVVQGSELKVVGEGFRIEADFNGSSGLPTLIVRVGEPRGLFESGIFGGAGGDMDAGRFIFTPVADGRVRVESDDLTAELESFTLPALASSQPEAAQKGPAMEVPSEVVAQVTPIPTGPAEPFAGERPVWDEQAALQRHLHELRLQLEQLRRQRGDNDAEVQTLQRAVDGLERQMQRLAGAEAAAQRSRPSVFIVGRIDRPGAYTLPEDGTLTLLQLIASAGGNAVVLEPEEFVITVVRGDGAREAYAAEALIGGAATGVELRAGDTVIVRPKSEEERGTDAGGEDAAVLEVLQAFLRERSDVPEFSGYELIRIVIAADEALGVAQLPAGPASEPVWVFRLERAGQGWRIDEHGRYTKHGAAAVEEQFREERPEARTLPVWSERDGQSSAGERERSREDERRAARREIQATQQRALMGAVEGLDELLRMDPSSEAYAAGLSAMRGLIDEAPAVMWPVTLEDGEWRLFSTPVARDRLIQLVRDLGPERLRHVAVMGAPGQADTEVQAMVDGLRAAGVEEVRVFTKSRPISPGDTHRPWTPAELRDWMERSGYSDRAEWYRGE